MCWSASVSLATYVLGLVGSGWYFIWTSKIPNVLFLNFVHMQLVEYVCWSNPTCNVINRVASKVGYSLLALQPICSYLSSTAYTSMRVAAYAGVLGTKTAMAMYSVFTAYMLYPLISTNEQSEVWCTNEDPEHNHLNWSWLKLYPAGSSLYFLLTFYPMIASGQWGAVSIYSSTLFYAVAKYIGTNTWGSVWCLGVNARSLGYILGV